MAEKRKQTNEERNAKRRLNHLKKKIRVGLQADTQHAATQRRCIKRKASTDIARKLALERYVALLT
jgi:hypothetical protein